MSAFDILALGITSIGCFLVGYFAGSKTSPKEEYEAIKKSIKKTTTPVGVVTRPSAETVNLWENPKKQEEDQAMSESLTRSFGPPPKI